jgi:hypothetical protein
MSASRRAGRIIGREGGRLYVWPRNGTLRAAVRPPAGARFSLWRKDGFAVFLHESLGPVEELEIRSRWPLRGLRAVAVAEPARKPGEFFWRACAVGRALPNRS